MNDKDEAISFNTALKEQAENLDNMNNGEKVAEFLEYERM